MTTFSCGGSSVRSGQQSTLTDVRLCLPEVWCDDAKCCEKAGIPEDPRGFLTQTAITCGDVTFILERQLPQRGRGQPDEEDPNADFIGERMGRFYLPGGSDVPPPHNLLAGRYEQEAKWDLALAEFDEIIHYHPDELPAHVGRIRVVPQDDGDRASARRCFKRSIRTLNDPASRRLLRESWDSPTVGAPEAMATLPESSRAF